jgi:NitT/TauT family transport system permease protein
MTPADAVAATVGTTEASAVARQEVTAPRRRSLRRPPRTSWRHRLVDTALVLSVLVVAIAVWELITVTGTVSKYVMPEPWSTMVALWDGLVTQGIWRDDIWVTFQEMAIGYAIGAPLGIIFGAILASSRRVERAFFPYVVFFQTVPLIAIAPLLLIWFGFGLHSKIVTVMLVVLFPVVVNTLAGLKATPQSRIDLLRSFKASPWQIFKKVKLPTAAPYILTGLEIAIVYAPVGAIVSEFLGGNAGIGIAIFQAEQNLDTSGVFALLIVLGAIGIALRTILVLVRRRVVFWERFTAVGWKATPGGTRR